MREVIGAGGILALVSQQDAPMETFLRGRTTARTAELAVVADRRFCETPFSAEVEELETRTTSAIAFL